jgi:hypothetical protein
MTNMPVHMRCPACLKQYSRSIRVRISNVYIHETTYQFEVICDAEGHQETITVAKFVA